MEETLGAVELGNEEVGETRVLQPQLDPITDDVLNLKIQSLANSVTLSQVDTVTVSGTTSETDLVNVTIPGGTLGTTGVIGVHLAVTGFYTNNARTITLKLYYGSTVVVNAGALSLTGSGISSQHFGTINAYITADASANAQNGVLLGLYSDGATGNPLQGGSGTATEDSSSSLTLRVTATISEAVSTIEMTVQGYVIY